MARLSAALALALFLAGPARAEWAVASPEKEKGRVAGLEHYRIMLTESEDDKRATLDLAVFSTRSATLRVIDNPGGHDNLAEIMRRENCLAGVNGGYFDFDDKPLGLLISDGNVIAALRKARLLSGVMVVLDGRIQLLRVAEYSSKRRATAALQCGPFLVDHGRPVPGLNGTRPARRTFIVTGGSDRAALGTCSDTTLAELGQILATPEITPGLKVQRALNLDGGSSTAFWFAGESGVFSTTEQKTVRDFVAVVPK